MNMRTVVAPAAALWRHRNVLRVLDNHEPPSGPFDPAAAWEHSYNIHFLNIRPKKAAGKGKGAKSAGRVRPDGTMTVVSKPKDPGIELKVTASALMGGDLTCVVAQCGDDLLCAPRSWEMTFGTTLESAARHVGFTQTGAVVDGVLLKDGKPVDGAPALSKWSCEWSLFAATQKLASRRAELPVAFDLVEYLDVPRGNQTLMFRGESKVDCGGKTIDAAEYVHYGEAILPTSYFVDTNNRLFMVLGTRRLFVLIDEKV